MKSGGFQNMKSKIIVSLAIVTILGISIIGQAAATSFSVHQTSYGRGTLYVGGSGPGNYTTISEAITNATQGDIIFVYNGTYAENLNVGKKISIIGEDKDITTIQGVTGEEKVIDIKSSFVTIQGFTIRGATLDQDAITVFSLMEDIIISDNIMESCAFGVWLQITSKRVTVTYNIFDGCEFTAIRLQESDRNTIAHNEINDCGEFAIALESASIQNNISYNTLIDNYGGIHLQGTSGQNDIMYNIIRNCDLEAILVEGLSHSNIIEFNNITDNYVGISFSNSNQNIVESNNIQGCTMEGFLLRSSSDNIINTNNFIDNKRQAAFRLSSRNSWDANYWDNWVGIRFTAPIFKLFPKVIGGSFRINLDSNPQLTPYVIP
jgi:parallel beta-helix repeat protein